MNIVLIFKTIYATTAVAFSALLIKDLRKSNFMKGRASMVISGLIGGIAYFLDTLGIGSFATSTVMLRSFKQVQDKDLPGSLNVASVLPILLEAFIFIGIIQVDPLTIVTMVSAACIGAWMGASVVHKLPEQRIRLIISIALFIAATVSLLKQLDFIPADYAGAIGLTGIKLVIAILASAIIGALGALGIGGYAPLLALALTLGLSSRAMFPIMSSSAALGGGFASIKFFKTGAYDRKASLAMTIVALLGVVIAAYIVKTLPLNILTWVVIGVIYYTAVSIFMSSCKRQ
ncbi:MAG TPA: permease [Coxiellaceae bacterium]|nr:permease [Coxiellaceae bacterium]HBY55917.1 permease [Coxiellaceae bacterium]